MAAVVPWDEMAKVFYDKMSLTQGRASTDLRVVLGALLVKHVEGLSDEDTIQYIQENLYAQYFVGLPKFQKKPIFVPSLFVEIRKRLGKEGSQLLNDKVLEQAVQLKAIKHRAKPHKQKKCEEGAEKEEAIEQEQTAGEAEKEEAIEQEQTAGEAEKEEAMEQEQTAGEAEKEEAMEQEQTAGEVEKEEAMEQEQAKQETPCKETPANKGTLKLDATVAPQHIGYPTDSRLLHEGRQESEALLDKLYEGGLWKKKPRTYRRLANKQYMNFSKKRKVTKKDIKRIRGQQLRYLRRNLGHINKMLDELEQAGQRPKWQHSDWQRFWVLQELYRQQNILHRDGRKQIEDRIVNIYQPYVRPIKRGKAGKPTEFGAKLNVSETEGFVRMDEVDFNNFHEGKGLEGQVEGYRALYGYYPEVVLVDRIYLTRENRNYLKSKSIRHCGIPLGRPKPMDAQQKQKRKKEQNKRAEIEGKFGQAKSKYGLDDIHMRRMDTSYACIGLILLAINVIKLAKATFISSFAACTSLWKLLKQQRMKLLSTSSNTYRGTAGKMEFYTLSYLIGH
jgi:chemotaxis protein histidine kinase CheA